MIIERLGRNVEKELIPAWLDNGLTYYKYSFYLKRLFGRRVNKACLDSGLSCPNRDGKISTGGCLFCDGESFIPSIKEMPDEVSHQLSAQIAKRERNSKRKDVGYMAYFQAGTNTYADVDKLKHLYDQVMDHPKVVGLIIGTRPDCVDEQILDLVASYSRDDFYVSIEYGVQTIHDKTLRWMNRGHDYESSKWAIREACARNIEVVTHLILGLPGETREDMLNTAREISDIGVKGVKLHNLHVTKGTLLEKEYLAGNIPLLGRKDYIELVVDFLSELSPEIVIQRLIAEASDEFLIAPNWVDEKQTVFLEIESLQNKIGTYQGKNYRTK